MTLQIYADIICLSFGKNLLNIYIYKRELKKTIPQNFIKTKYLVLLSVKLFQSKVIMMTLFVMNNNEVHIKVKKNSGNSVENIYQNRVKHKLGLPKVHISHLFHPEIETGSPAWQASVLLLTDWCFYCLKIKVYISNNYFLAT